jgi:hypothetical protein
MPAHSRQTAPEATSTAGMLLSLTSALPDPSGPLARRARRLARNLTLTGSTRALERTAAEVLADLLTATDVDLAYPEDGLLDESFDE